MPDTLTAPFPITDDVVSRLKRASGGVTDDIELLLENSVNEHTGVAFDEPFITRLACSYALAAQDAKDAFGIFLERLRRDRPELRGHASRSMALKLTRGFYACPSDPPIERAEAIEAAADAFIAATGPYQSDEDAQRLRVWGCIALERLAEAQRAEDHLQLACAMRMDC